MIKAAYGRKHVIGGLVSFGELAMAGSMVAGSQGAGEAAEGLQLSHKMVTERKRLILAVAFEVSKPQ